MAEYIEREAALAFQNEVEPLLCRNVVTHDIMSATKDADMVKYLQSIPAADVRPVVKAYWIGEGDGYADGEMVYDVWSCSNCGYTVDEGDNELPQYSFCPGCGADMRGGEAGE